MLRPCTRCGEPTPDSRCADCAADGARIRAARRTTTTRGLGYGTPWRRLSERARRLQPWCSDCGTTEDLTCDHSPTAWHRYEAGKAVRLRDVEVTCRACNTRRGSSRPGGVVTPRERTIAAGRPSSPHTRGAS